MNETTPPTTTERSFIGKPKGPTAPDPTEKPPLMSTLPKEPETMSHAELLESYYKLALRCFQSENSLDMAKQLIVGYEQLIVVYDKVISDQREDIIKILNESRKGFLTDWKLVDSIQEKYSTATK